MNAKDTKIIADNPKATAYELLEKGLTQKSFQELLSKESSEPKGKAPAEPDKPKVKVKPLVVENSQRAAPALRQFVLPSLSVNGMSTVLDLTTGIKSEMTTVSAERLERKYPKEFQIIK